MLRWLIRLGEWDFASAFSIAFQSIVGNLRTWMNRDDG